MMIVIFTNLAIAASMNTLLLIHCHFGYICIFKSYAVTKGGFREGKEAIAPYFQQGVWHFNQLSKTIDKCY